MRVSHVCVEQTHGCKITVVRKRLTSSPGENLSRGSIYSPNLANHTP